MRNLQALCACGHEHISLVAPLVSQRLHSDVIKGTARASRGAQIKKYLVGLINRYWC